MRTKCVNSFKENAMAVTATRLSDTEVQVERTVYTFSASDVADAFQRCVGQDSIDTCRSNHPPASQHAVDAADAGNDDVPPGSIISPSMGGMP